MNLFVIYKFIQVATAAEFILASDGYSQFDICLENGIIWPENSTEETDRSEEPEITESS